MSKQLDELTKGVVRRAALKKFSVGLAGMALATRLFVAFAPAEPPAQASPPIPWSQIGATAGADYKGDGLAVSATETGARLHCVFQRLDGEATREGLWLTCTVPDLPSDRFRVVAAAIGNHHLARSGTVTMTENRVKFSRPGLMEEYALSMDGVRQDFVVESRPAGEALLMLELAKTGARVEESAYGAELILENSGRKIAYSRLKVTDANGKELPARMEVTDRSEVRNPKSKMRMAVVVDDSDAAYPLRIDPTFSDANWISMGGISGANAPVYAVVVDGSGSLYIGGAFTVVGDVVANRIAKWNGSSWNSLGSGIEPGMVVINSPLSPTVLALALSGNDLYAGGVFRNAGGIVASNIARWDGTNWTALGSGLGNDVTRTPAAVKALAVSGGDVYAGGEFTKAGGLPANYIAKWNGSTWSVPGSGMDGVVNALVASGNDVYAGGGFTTAGGMSFNNIAKWDGSNWSPLGSGMSG